MTLNYVLLPRLEDIALRKVVVMLWNEMDVLCQFGVDYFDSHLLLEAHFKNDVFHVEYKLLKLELPVLLAMKASPLVEILGLEITKWINFNYEFLKFPCIYFEREKRSCVTIKFHFVSEKLQWTSVGSINYRKTAEEIIRSKMFDSFLLYKLACLYCLEDQIPVLWDGFSEAIKDSFYDENDQFQLTQSHLDAFWTNIIRFADDASGDVGREPFDNIDNFYQRAFEVSVNTGSKAAVEYFYKKLTHDEKENSLLKTAYDVATKDTISIYSPNKMLVNKYTDILCYLLSQMIPAKQMEFFQAHPYDVSSCFLVWPWQDLFLDVAQLTLKFLSESSYCLLLQDICTKAISREIKLDLFRKFFLLSPENLRSCFIDKECGADENFLEVVTSRESEILRCILRNIEPAAKVRLVFSKQGFRICCHMMWDEKWNLLNLFVCEAILSEEHRKQFRYDFMSNILQYFVERDLRRKLEKWEQSFSIENDELILEGDPVRKYDE